MSWSGLHGGRSGSTSRLKSVLNYSVSGDMDPQHNCFYICVERTGEIVKNSKGNPKTLSRLLTISPHKEKLAM